MRAWIPIILLMFCAACYPVRLGYISQLPSRPAVSVEHVKVFLEEPSEPWVLMGVIDASIYKEGQWATDKVLDAIKKKAAEVGADGVILVDHSQKEISGGGVYTGVQQANGGFTAFGIPAAYPKMLTKAKVIAFKR